MRKERKIINTNIRLNLCDEQDRQAWEYLQTMDREKYKSYTRAVVVALNDYFSREYRNEADPYLETREKEDAFQERVETAIRDGVKESVPMAMAKNLRNIHLGATIVGIYRQDVYEIPPDAIRELIINAMVHRSYLDHGTIQVAVYDNRLEIISPGKLPMGQTMERMKEGYSKIRNEALAHAFAYMNLIEHWGSGIPRIIDKVKSAGLREPEFIGGEVDLRINIYRGQVDTNNAIINANGTKNGANGVKCGSDNGTNGAEVPLNKEQTQIEKLLQIIEKNPFATQAYYAEKMGISKRTVSRMFASLQEKGRLVQGGTKRKANWKIIR